MMTLIVAATISVGAYYSRRADTTPTLTTEARHAATSWALVVTRATSSARPSAATTTKASTTTGNPLLPSRPAGGPRPPGL